MKKFVFSLQKVFEFRQTIEDRLLGELAAIRAECDRERLKLDEMTDALQLFRLKMKEILSSGEVDRIKQGFWFLQQLEAEIAQQKLIIQQAEQREKSKMAEVVKASMDRKAMERLKELKYKEYQDDIAYEEQKFLDDIATIKHSRARQVA